MILKKQNKETQALPLIRNKEAKALPVLFVISTCSVPSIAPPGGAGEAEELHTPQCWFPSVVMVSVE